jgi:hypothetical protein
VRPSAERHDNGPDDQRRPRASSAPVQPASEPARREGEQERDPVKADSGVAAELERIARELRDKP